MQFRKYLTEDSVFLDRDFESLEEVLIFLSEVFARRTGLDKEFIHKLLDEREKLSSTWIGNETMLPHNHNPEIRDINMIFIRCRKPFVLKGGNSVRYVFSILTSGTQEQLYLSVLQGIGRLIQNQSAEVDRCSSPAELFELLVSSRYMMGSPLTAADLVRPYWPSVKQGDTLSTALDLMKQNDVYFLPVFSGKDGKICGVLDLVDLLKAGFPDYVFRLNNISVIKDFKPVKYFWEKENDLSIAQYIRDYRPYMIHGDASYPEIFFTMIKGSRRHLLVLNKEDELIGVIHPHEIINKMLRP
jgi:mannitol/fructose-specific phosphotransferase system IIA component (Ntr-type)/CBS domain-containing protein